MDATGLKDKLLSVITNIEGRTDSELIAVLKDTLTAVGTGTPIDSVNEQYQFIYQTLDSRLSSLNQPHGNQFDDLWAFYYFWKEQGMDTYASRRAFVRGLYKSEQPAPDDPFWSMINPVIRNLAKPRFDSKQYADAVEACFKEINSRIKEHVRQRTGEYADGSDLMNRAFSIKKPIIVLDDLETEDGKNIQVGYMQMFSGAMTGIRNPKAHANHDTTAEEAMPLIHFASHLFEKYEQATQDRIEVLPKEEVENQGITTLYLRVTDPDDQQKLLGIKKLMSSSPGETQAILVLGQSAKSSIRLPMTVDTSQAEFMNALKQLLGAKNVIVGTRTAKTQK